MALKYKVDYEFVLNTDVLYQEFGFDVCTGAISQIVGVNEFSKRPYVIEDEHSNFIMSVTEDDLTSLIIKPVYPIGDTKTVGWTIVIKDYSYGNECSRIISCPEEGSLKKLIEVNRGDVEPENILVFPPNSNVTASELYKED